jgi:hypothetical protein
LRMWLKFDSVFNSIGGQNASVSANAAFHLHKSTSYDAVRNSVISAFLMRRGLNIKFMDFSPNPEAAAGQI